MKVVSLVPSITEALFDLGLTEHEVVGRTKFCIHPEDKVKNVAVIGGTKNISIDKIKALYQPQSGWNPARLIENRNEGFLLL